MRLIVNSQLLATELRLLNKVVPSKPTLAILSHALFTADGGTLSLHATDLEISLGTSCPASVQVPGAVALPVTKFLALVEQFSDADVEIVADRHQVLVACGAFKSRLQALPVTDFPVLPALDGAATMLDAAMLRRLIAKTRYAVTSVGSKYVLQGALLTLQGEVAAMVATDSKRLALATMRSDGNELRMLIPVKMLDMLAGQADEGDLEVTIGARHLFFSIGGRLLLSRMIDGEFPKYERIIPQNNDKVVTVDRGAFQAALKRAVLIAEESAAVYLSLTSGLMELSTASAEVGSADEALRVGYAAEPLKICVNGRYALDFLDASTAPTIMIHLKDALGAALFTEGNDHVAVIMLMRAQ